MPDEAGRVPRLGACSQLTICDCCRKTGTMVDATMQGDALLALDSAINSLEGELNDYRSRLDTWAEDVRAKLASQKAALDEDSSTRAQQLDEQASRLRAEKEQLDEAQQALGRTKVEHEKRDAECEQRASKLAELTQQLDKREQALKEWEKKAKGQFAGVQREQGEAEKNLASRQQEIERAESDFQKKAAKLATQEEQLTKANEQATARQAELDRHGKEVAAAQAELAKCDKMR